MVVCFRSSFPGRQGTPRGQGPCLFVAVSELMICWESYSRGNPLLVQCRSRSWAAARVLRSIGQDCRAPLSSCGPRQEETHGVKRRREIRRWSWWVWAPCFLFVFVVFQFFRGCCRCSINVGWLDKPTNFGMVFQRPFYQIISFDPHNNPER